MPSINEQGYVAIAGRAGKNPVAKNTTRNFWMVRYGSNGRLGVQIGNVGFPEHLAGKRVRFKLEIIED